MNNFFMQHLQVLNIMFEILLKFLKIICNKVI